MRELKQKVKRKQLRRSKKMDHLRNGGNEKGGDTFVKI